MRIGIVVNSLRTGGSERQATLWARVCRDLGHDVTMLLLNDVPISYDVPAGVALRYARKTRPADAYKVAWHTSSLARNVDAMVAFERYPAVFCAYSYPAVPWIAVTGDDPRLWRESSSVPLSVYRRAFRRATMASAPSQGSVDCHKELGIHPRGDWIAIPNIAADEAFLTPAAGGTGALFVGRFVDRKDPLLAVAAAVRAGVPLTLLGRGPLERELALRARAEAPGAITLRQFTTQPWEIYRDHRVVLVTSRGETFGNVIVEGLAAGTPVVAVDCDFGPREILRGAAYSTLVPSDATALAGALERVVRRSYSAAEADECVAIAERYRAARIAPMIARLLSDTVAADHSRSHAPAVSDPAGARSDPAV
jgi:glycosyltransferase involved in cell wall biosynthesis